MYLTNFLPFALDPGKIRINIIHRAWKQEEVMEHMCQS